MTMFNYRSSIIWNTILLISVIFASFILPVLPYSWHRISFQAVYTVMYFSAVLSLEKRNRYMIAFAFLTFALQLASLLLNLQFILGISRSANIIFFFVIVFYLIRQIATAKKVNSRVIFNSIAGYLLIGIIYAIFITFIVQHDPGAFNYAHTPDQPEINTDASISLYYGYITLATVGYGDIVPLKPYTRSLATFIAVSGQFYIAIIVALLVGKFAAQRETEHSIGDE
jgi:voltage-gated potassium channel